MPIPSPSTRLPRARWSSQLRNVGVAFIAAAAVAGAAPGLIAAAAQASARGTIHLRGSLWIDCRGDGRRSAQDPPVREAIVELVTSSGQLSTTVTNRAGGYAFTLRGGLPDAVVVPLIQTALNGLVPSPTSDSQPVPGRSVGRRVADLDRVTVTAAGARRSASRYDFGFVAGTASGRALTRAECPGASKAGRLV